ncbi:hypothetical protein OIU84_009839 [Salix udensis]|uniref:Uncharacterized protein n=1 Tax=Salix udensis TaxID=889485 RepID=A0AAD6JJE0_9ROSI|nr:hypothetical protein OIU84_009839 [Salix udensis]
MLRNLLVSSGADAQIFVWKIEGWGKERSRFLSIHDGRTLSSLSLDTDIQSHQNQTEFHAWSPGDFGAPISHATFSCDGQMVHASFEDGVVSIFDASAQMYCLVFSSTQTTMADHWPMLLSYNDPPPLLTMTFSDGARNGKQGKGN